MTPRPVFIDTDIGLGTPQAEIDDGAALLVMLRAADVQVCGVGTVHGNVAVDQAIHNARRLLAYENCEQIPVGRGAALPLVQDPGWFAGWRAAYGQTEPWPGGAALPPAAGLLIDAARAFPHRLAVLAIGPLTNLALAARLAPDIVPLVGEVVAMGGSFGAAQPGAEFNLRCDPEAAAIVLHAGWPVRLFGLEVTRQVRFGRAEFAALPEHRPAVRLLRHQAPGWIDRVEAQGWEAGGCSLHDAVAAAALLDETLCDYVETGVSVELADPARRGETRFHARAIGLRVATDVDADRCHALIWKHIAG
jgi:inosine-uridine nucleoside N-ribohydrolase